MPTHRQTRQPEPGSPPRRRRWRALIAAAAIVLAGSGAAASVPGSWSTPASATTIQSTAARATDSLDASTIADRVEPAVANITTTLANGQGEAAGTGIVLSSSGRVLTNNHVIANATEIRVAIGGSSRSHPAEVLGYDVANDVALLQVDGVSALQPATLGDSSAVSTGDAVVALGNALGRGGTPAVTTGSVVSLDQTIDVSDATGASSETLDGLIKSDAPLQPGESGGPLVDDQGEVIGMNTAANQSTPYETVASDIGFAIPINDAMAIARQVAAGDSGGTVHIGKRAMLGVQVRDLGRFDRFGGTASSDGVQVVGVQAGSPADAAGLVPGDTVVSLAGTTIATTSELNTALAPHHPKDTVTVVWLDGAGNRHSATVALIAGPPA